MGAKPGRPENYAGRIAKLEGQMEHALVPDFVTGNRLDEVTARLDELARLVDEMRNPGRKSQPGL